MRRGARGAGFAVAITLATASPALAEVVITHDAVDCVVAGRFPLIRAGLEPRAEVAQARVYFQARGTPHWYYVEMRSDGAAAFEATLPRPLDSLQGLNYYIEALGRGLAQGRTRDYAARVTTEDRGCPAGLRMATVGSAPSSLVVGAAEGAPALPPGFSHAGLVSSVTGSAASAAGAGATGTGGISTGMLVGLGAAAATAGIAVAAGGGGGDTQGEATPSGPSPVAMPTPTPTPTPTPAPDLTGRWAGQFVEVPSAVQCSVTSDLNLDLRQSMTNLTGTFQLAIRSATPAPQDPCPVRPGDVFTGPVSGVLNGDSISLQLQITGGPSFFLHGTVSGNRMGGTSPPDSDGPGGSWELVRQ
jgi:hypothetical protein